MDKLLCSAVASVLNYKSVALGSNPTLASQQAAHSAVTPFKDMQDVGTWGNLGKGNCGNSNFTLVLYEVLSHHRLKGPMAWR